MDELVLIARVDQEDNCFVARLEQIQLEGSGESVKEAQDELILAMRAWIQTHDAQDDLEQILAQAGFPGVEEGTELRLQFD